MLINCESPYLKNLSLKTLQYVGIFKTALVKQLFHDTSTKVSRTIQHKIDCFLFAYRNTPHTTTGKTPAELFLGFKPRSRLSLIKPHLQSSVEKQQERMKINFDKHRSTRYFTVGQDVLVKTVRQEEIKWIPGRIKKVISPMTYLVTVMGRPRFCHADHLRDASVETISQPIQEGNSNGLVSPKKPTPTKPNLTPSESRLNQDQPPNQSPTKKSTVTSSTEVSSPTRKPQFPDQSNPVAEPTPVRKSARLKRAPQRLDL